MRGWRLDIRLSIILITKLEMMLGDFIPFFFLNYFDEEQAEQLYIVDKL